MYRLDSHNPYPECLSLTLDSCITSQETLTSFNLILTLKLGEQTTNLLEGRIKWRLRGGRLKLLAQNGTIEPILPINATEAHLKSSSPSQVILEFRLDSLVKSTPIVYSSLHIAQFTPISHPNYLNINWEVSPSDIFLTDAEGLWKHDITPNQHAILERSIIHWLYINQFTAYLSQLRLTSDQTIISKILPKNTPNDLNPNVFTKLNTLMNSIYQAKTDNLLELSQLAGLNPLTDLEGGNLMATSLNGLSLGEAQLNYTNFRGANLTDVDLSEAQLNYTNFAGADLSGAYLGNANLQFADFHRGSLALANLIGANLTEANLIETNLSQANLSGAIVTHAKFGNNIGLTPEMQESLQERGAIFD